MADGFKKFSLIKFVTCDEKEKAMSDSTMCNASSVYAARET